MKSPKCNLCNNNLHNQQILRLNNVPSSAQEFTNKKKVSLINLKVFKCKKCDLVQINSKPVKYFKEVIRSGKFSESMLNFRKKQFRNFVRKFNLKNKNIIEIGSGDGQYLNILKKFCKNSYGLEFSKKLINKAKKDKLKIFKGYSEKNFIIKRKKFDAFICLSFIEHAPKLNDFLNNIYKNLNDDAVGIVEVPNYEMIENKKLYFEFIPDHLNYFTKKTFKNALELNGFEVLELKINWYEYILTAIVKKNKNILINFGKEITKIKKSFINFKKKNNLKNICVWGAGHQSLTVLSITSIYKNIKYIIDSANFKQNKYSPGVGILVISPLDIKSKKVDGIIIMAGSYSKEIIKITKKKFKKIKLGIFENNEIKSISI